MAHYDLFDGSIKLSEFDLAKEVYSSLERKELIRVTGEKTEKGVSLSVGLDEIPQIAGNYLIYYKDSFNQYICVYAGESNSEEGGLRYRIYRFVKELADMSRDDEGHSAAKKIRQLGLLRHDDDIYVRYITKLEMYYIVASTLCNHLHLVLRNIDECIAHLAGAIFNKRVKKA